MATYYMAGGETIPLLPPFNAGFCKRELQGLVEGEFDTISLRDGTLLIINAEAYGIGFEKNEAATELAVGCIVKDTWIAGNALHVTTVECEEEKKNEVKSHVYR